MKACMGGFCVRRDQCPHYSAEGQSPAERLCLPARDGIRLIEATPFRTLTVDVFAGRVTRATEKEAA